MHSVVLGRGNTLYPSPILQMLYSGTDTVWLLLETHNNLCTVYGDTLLQVDMLEKQSFCEPLKPASEYGDLLMSLCYVPSDKLTVTVLKAWDLRSMDINLKSGDSHYHWNSKKTLS
jgi:hypothetical protein